MHWRWIDRGIEDGPTQMAIDQAMILDAKDSPQATFRVYQWQPYCISLGYHQSPEILNLSLCQRNGIDVVRRPTGGRAVFHAEELTYSAVVPFGLGSDPELDTCQAVYSWISERLAEAVQTFGVPARLERRRLDFKNHYQTSESNSCFSAAARSEVMIEGKKLIGSAQRKYSWGVLQHGSILLGKAHLDLPCYFKNTPERVRGRLKDSLEEKTVTLNDQISKAITAADLGYAIRKAFQFTTNIEFEYVNLSARECSHLDHFRAEATILKTQSSLRQLSNTGSWP